MKSYFWHQKSIPRPQLSGIWWFKCQNRTRTVEVRLPRLALNVLLRNRNRNRVPGSWPDLEPWNRFLNNPGNWEAYITHWGKNAPSNWRGNCTTNAHHTLVDNPPSKSMQDEGEFSVVMHCVCCKMPPQTTGGNGGIVQQFHVSRLLRGNSTASIIEYN